MGLRLRWPCGVKLYVRWLQWVAFGVCRALRGETRHPLRVAWVRAIYSAPVRFTPLNHPKPPTLSTTSPQTPWQTPTGNDGRRRRRSAESAISGIDRAAKRARSPPSMRHSLPTSPRRASRPHPTQPQPNGRDTDSQLHTRQRERHLYPTHTATHTHANSWSNAIGRLKPGQGWRRRAAGAAGHTEQHPPPPAPREQRP